MRVLFLLPLVPLAWLGYQTCPCLVENDESSAEFRLTSQPNTCATFSIPSTWVRPDGEAVFQVVAPDSMFYELRHSTKAADEFLIGLRFAETERPGIVQYAINTFSFRFHPADTKTDAKVDGVRPVSQETWASSQSLPHLDTELTTVTLNVSASVEGDYVVFKGHRFPKHEKYAGVQWKQMVSVNEEYIAVSSHGGPALPEGLRLDPLPDPWRRTATVDIFRISTGLRVARVRGWTCVGGLGQLNLLIWHGDEFLSMPITRDGREILLCDFRGK
jgi:hypothetical protein